MGAKYTRLVRFRQRNELVIRFSAILFMLLLSSMLLQAQQPVQVIWPLTSDGEAVYSSGIGSASFKPGPGLISFRYDSINGATATGWNSRNLNPNAYFEYTIVPERDATLLINQLKFEVSLSSVNMRTALYYSKDGFLQQSVPMGNTVFVGKKSSRDLLVETAITVTYPETLSIRVYGWSAPNPAVSFYAGNVEFGGVIPADEDETPQPPVLIADDNQDGGDRAPLGSTPYLSSGTWTCPPNIFSVTAECWAGGGKGGTVNQNSSTSGGGGGGGGYSRKVIPVIPGNTYTVTVGLGSTTTAPGGDSWFIDATTVLAKGGLSVANNSNVGANGGPVGIGDVSYIGGRGANGIAGNYGGGGGSSASTSGNGVNAISSYLGGIAPAGGGNGGDGALGVGPGNPGNVPGGGGGGAMKLTGNSTQVGGNGANGKVIITFCQLPAIFTVTGGGSYCSGGTGITVGLDGSELGCTYQLYRDVITAVGAPLNGTGAALSYGNQLIAGTYTVVATRLDGMCTQNMSGSAVVSIYPLPTATISGSTTVCQNAPEPLVTFTGANGTAPYIFTYKINGGADIVTPAGNPVTVSVPTNVIGNFFYTLVSVQDANGCSQNQSGSATVTVSPGPPAQPGTITGNATPCPGLASQTYSITPVPTATTYTWTVPTGWSITAGNGTNTITVTTGAFGQNGNITVTAGNFCGTSAPSTLAVTVQPGTPAVPGPISGLTTQCPNVTGQIYSVTPDPIATNYVWTVPVGWTVTAGATTSSITVTTGNTGQNGNITVKASNSCGTSAAQLLAVSVGPGIPATPGAISGTANVCPNTSNLIYSIANVANATSYTWTVPGGWVINSGQGTNSITVTSGATGNNGNITVTANNICGSSPASSLAVTVLPGTPATPGPITGTVTQCGNLTGQIYSIALVANASSYTWAVPTGWVITAGQGSNSITVTTGAPGQNGSISVIATNSCGTSAASTLAVTVNAPAPATPGPITGPIDHCFQQNGQVYSINPVANATTYTWTVPTGWTITAGQNTTSITVNTGTPGQNGNITVTAGNICGTSAPATLAVTVSTTPAPTSAITPAPPSVCQGASLTFSVTAVAGVTYTWTVPGDWTITAGQGTNQITLTVGTIAGNITVTPSNHCGNGAPASLAVTVNLLPTSAGPIDGDIEFCQGTTGHSYSVVFDPSVTNYQWTVPAGWTITVGQGTNHIEADVSVTGVSGQVVVTPQNACGNGPSSTLNVTVNPLPAAFTGPDAGICAGGQAVIGAPAVPGNSYSWTSVPAGFFSTDANPTVQPFVTTTYYLIETNNTTGCSNTNDITITTNQQLFLTVSPPTQTICPGADFTINVSSNISGTTYYWERDNTTVLTGTPDNGTIVPITGTLNSTNPSGYEVTNFTITGTSVGANCADKQQVEVVVIDNIAPIVTCPGDQSRNTTPGTCSYTTIGTEFDPTVTDDCSVILSNNINGNATLAGEVFAVGSHNIIWTATDPGNHTSSCSFRIEVIDNIPPVISCVGNQTVNVTSNCSYLHTGTGWDATATDNCGIVSLTYNLTGATTGTGTSLNNVTFLGGTTTVTWTANDGSNIITCVYTVTVVDNVPPTITCPGPVTASANGNNCRTGVTIAHPAISDNCTISSLTWTITGATTGTSPATGINYVPDNHDFNVGVSTVTYVITDQAGLTATCSITVTVNDTKIPTVTCPTPAASYPNVLNQCYATLSFTATASDNCGIQAINYYIGGLSGTQITFPYNFPVGTTVVTVQATDLSGNLSAPCSFSVLVIDTQLPIIQCVSSPQSRTANSGACTYTAVGTEFDPPSFSDNCPGAFVTNNKTNTSTLAGAVFSGTSTVIWTVQDAAGNKANCSVTVIVTDNQLPVFTNCPTDITVYTGLNRMTCDQNASWIPPIATDNCGGSLTVTSNYSPGALFPVGNTTVIYTATDPAGNSTTCSFLVVVVDNTIPTYTVPAPITVYLSGSCTYNAGIGITGDVNNEFDNCTPSGLQATFSDNIVAGACPGTFIITRTWTLVDNHGNSNVQTQIITVADNLAPTLNEPNDITVQCHQGTDPSVTGQPTGSDNCSNAVTFSYTDVTSAGTCPNASNIVRTWTATDCSGNVTTDIQNIYVVDNIDPVVSNIVHYTVDCPVDIPVIDISDITATDNCGPVTVVFDHEIAQFPPDVPGYCPRYIERFYIVEDACGNTTVAIQNITILSVCECSNCDTIAPTFEIDLLGQPNGDTTIYGAHRAGLCCHANKPDDCISFNVRIDIGSVGVQITVNGAVPAAHEWKVDCEDVEINDGIICLPGGTFYLFTFCKPGTNANDYRFQALADIVVAGEFETRISCNSQIEVSSNVDSVTWNSIFPGIPGQYNSYLSCLDCLNPFFNPAPGAPPVIKYQVCGTVAGSPCVGTLGYGCDTVTMYVHEPINVTFNVDPGQFCLEAIPVIIATVTPGGTTYILEWYAGSDTSAVPLHTGNNFLAPGPGPYTLVVIDTEEGVPCSTYVYPFVVAPDDDPPVITVPAPLTLECNASGNTQAIQDWLALAFATDEHPLILSHDYNGITEACGTVVTVTWTAIDDCNNDTTASSTITITDTQVPTWITPLTSLDRTLECSDAAGLTAAQALTPIGDDQCDNDLTLTRTSVYTADPTCPTGGTYTITFIAEDDCLNKSTSFIQTITIEDNTAPNWTTPAGALDASFDCSDITGIAAAQDALPVATDNCDLSVILNKVSGSFIADPTCDNAGTYTNTVTATDHCGNISTVYTQVITITDNNLPTITQQAQNMTVECDGAGNITEYTNWLNTNGGATATDACGGALTWSYGTPSFFAQCGTTGVYTATFTVTDDCNNSASTIATFTIVDTQAPTIICPADVVANVDLTNCVATGVDLGTPIVSEDCSGTTVTNDAPAAFPPGVTIVTWTVTDDCGFTAICTQTVTVQDLLPPSVVCPLDPAPVNADPDDCKAYVTVPAPNVTDPCPVIVTNDSPYRTSLTNASGTYPVGATTFTWTITGISGIDTTCTQTVTVIDAQDPTIACPPNQLFTAPAPACTLLVTTIPAPIYDDNCALPAAPLTWDLTGATTGSGTGSVNGTIFNVGITTVTYTVTDAYGNTASCSFTVTVNDDVPPTVVNCPADVTVNVDPNSCYANVTIPPLVVSDLCDNIVSIVNDFNNTNNASGQYPVGTTTVTWTITDESGNITQCIHDVKVIDNIAPILSCPPDAIDEITNGGCTWVPSTIQDPQYEDNCDLNDPTATLILTWQMFGATTGFSPLTGFNLVNNETFNIGITRVLYKLIDASGNFDSCSFYVWIKNFDAPQFQVTCPQASIPANAGPDCETFVTVPAPGISNPCNESFTITNTSPYKTSDANASGIYPVGTTSFTWTIIDASGTPTVCPQSVTVTDNMLPLLTCPPDAIDLIIDNGCDMIPATIGLPFTTDNCDGGDPQNTLTLTWQMFGATVGNSPITGYNTVNGQIFNIGKTRVLYTLTDAAGNWDTCSFQVWVKNLDEPQFKADCPISPVTIDAGPDCDTFVTVPSPAITNPCNETFTITNTSPHKTSDANASGTYPVGTTSFTWTIIDASGNITTCAQSVIVTDNTPPSLSCPPNAEDEIVNGGCDMVPATIGLPITSDNCDGDDPENTLTLTWQMFGATIGISPISGYNTVNGQLFYIGKTRVLYTLTDAAGNWDTCSFQVWVKSLDDPQFEVTCPPVSLTVSANLNSCDAFVTVPSPTIINPCAEEYKISNDSPYGIPADGIYPVGTTLITWEIIDASGTPIYCFQNIIVVDDTDPTLNCPANIVEDADFEQTYATNVTVPPPTYWDACGVEHLSYVSSAPTPLASPLTGINIFPSPYTFNVGVTTITYTATDFNGNVSTCSFTVTVLSEPVIVCEDPINTTTDPGYCSATLDPGYPELISGVEPITWTWSITNEAGTVIGTGGPCTTAALSTCLGSFQFPVGENTITWTATNISGTTECTQTVIVVDDEPLTFTVPAPSSHCVNNIINAVYNPTPTPGIIPEYDDITHPRPEYYDFNLGNIILDITPDMYGDNCCEDEDIIIHWRLNFTSVPNPATVLHELITQPAIPDQIGLPSEYGEIHFPGDGVYFTNIDHYLYYWLEDCNGNLTTEQMVTITIKPRPNVIKQP